MSKKGYNKLPKVEMVPLPENLHIPPDIPASKIRIPLTYREGSVQYENNREDIVSENEATHLRFTSKDKKTEIVVGPVNQRGMFKLMVYFNKDKRPVSKDKAYMSRELILNENFKDIRLYK
ncbi:hypothetical protein [Methanobacterium oryzae]|uniref:hypothetical protein n=1 Tax=Methanobacterium oryzae TaxID=69540 RepID=UPI003D1A0F80